jgi:hypothetical protein
MLTGDGRSGDSTPTFLGWEGDPRQATDPKIAGRELAAALERFAARFGQPATVVRMPLTSLITEYPGVQVELTRTVPPGQVWPGAVLPGPDLGAAEAAPPAEPADRDPALEGWEAEPDAGRGRAHA